MSKEYSLSTQAAYVFIGKLSSFFLRFLVPIVLVRIFTRQDFGVYQQVLLISTTFVQVLKWGLINSLFYFYPLAKKKISILLSQTFYFIVFVGLIFIPIIILLRYPIANFFHSPLIISVMWPISFYFFFMLTSLILDSLFILEQQSKRVVIYEITNQILRIIIIISIALLINNIVFLFWGLTIYASFRTIFLYIYLKKNYRIGFQKIEFPYLFSQIKYAFPIGAARLSSEIGKRIDKFILSGFLSPAHFAIYIVANIKIPFLDVFYTSVGNVTIPAMTRYYHDGELKNVKYLWHKMIVQYAAITIPSVVFFFIFANEIITLLFTTKYIDCVPVYRIFLLWMLCRMINPSSVLRACKETKVMFQSSLYSSIVAVILSYILISNYGMIGGAISVVTSSYLRIAIRVFSIRKKFELKISELLPWVDILKILAYSLFTAFIIISITFLKFSALFKILTAGSIYLTIIFLLSIFYKYLEINQVKVIIKSLYKTN